MITKERRAELQEERRNGGASGIGFAEVWDLLDALDEADSTIATLQLQIVESQRLFKSGAGPMILCESK